MRSAPQATGGLHLDARQRRQSSIGVSYLSCGYRDEFLAQVRALTEDARLHGRRPVLHIECHGDEARGLVFANDSELPWDALAEELEALNAATGFNLFVVVAACYGGHFLSQLHNGRPAPCLALIGPTEEVSPAEIMAGFMRFYRGLFDSMDAGKAARSMRGLQMSNGRWPVQHAEFWYSAVATGYVETHCSLAAIKARALQLRRQTLGNGVDVSMAVLKGMIKQAHRTRLAGTMFDTYFMVDLMPTNRRRFEPARRRLEIKLDELRRSGRYAI